MMTCLLAGLTLGLLAVGTLWLRATLRRTAAQESAASVSGPDLAYSALLAQAEGEITRQDYRLAAALLKQALFQRPDRPEARARLESLRAQLMREHPALAAPPAPAPSLPPPAPPPRLPDTDMIPIPGGAFSMGANQPDGEADESPAHEVTLAPFFIERHEVTVAKYRQFCDQTHRPFPRQPPWSTPQHPMVSVTWHDALAYCRHHGRRLPTEAEWERAARCQTTGRYAFGALPQLIAQYAWFADNSEDQAHPVGMRAPAGCGIYDAYGNVWEWVADWYSATYYDDSPKDNPRGPRSGEEKVLRGGAYDSPVADMALTFREKFSPDYGAENRGFRCASSQAP
jgi:formylglycine-generating enzyme required for sulfatase activity